MTDRPPVLLSVADAGQELYSVRPKPGPIAWLVFVGLLALAFLMGWLAPASGLVGGFAALAGAVVILVPLFGVGMLEKHRVCENALVLGLTPWPGGEPYVIPWSTVPPDSLLLHDPATRAGAGAAGQSGARGTRMAIFSRKAVSLVGLHHDLAHPRRRQTTEFARQVLARVTPEELALRPPLVSWAMGVRKPEPLLRAIEAALVRFRPEAAGSADHALAHPVHGPRPD
ncbi:MAG TPA: hypothetical protein VGD34_20775 [Kribbella sp.]|jgi:hypothetical protein